MIFVNGAGIKRPSVNDDQIYVGDMKRHKSVAEESVFTTLKAFLQKFVFFAKFNVNFANLGTERSSDSQVSVGKRIKSRHSTSGGQFLFNRRFFQRKIRIFLNFLKLLQIFNNYFAESHFTVDYLPKNSRFKMYRRSDGKKMKNLSNFGRS